MLLVPESAFAGVSRCTARVAGIDGVPYALVEEWQALAMLAAEPNAFAEAWFVVPALAALRRGRSVRVIEVRDEADMLVGVMALTLYSRYGRMPVRHASNWTHYQCFMGTPLIRQGDEEGFWRAVLSLLDKSGWAHGFLSVSGLLEHGAAHRGLIAAGRPCPTVHRTERAALESDLTPDAYLERTIRGKKRKELRRLGNRLSDLGTIAFSVLERADQLENWCDAFLALEAAGWKGSHGSAFANEPETEGFFRAVVKGAFEAGRLDFQRLDLDGRPIAMLVNFRTPPGSWSFKIAYDEELARFSPGVLIELENLPRVLSDPDIDWMDSCAVEDHPMINSLWGERRTIVQVSVPLSGAWRSMVYRLCRAAETGSARLRRILGKS